MAQSNLSGPLVITDGLEVGGTALITGAVTLSGGISVGSGTVTAGVVKYASTTATGGTIDSTSARGAVLAWAPTTATGGTADSTSARAAVVQANTTLKWATSGATGGTAAAGGLSQGGYLKSGGGTIYWATRLQKYAAASAGWNDGVVYSVGDIIWNGAPASGSAVGWICATLGTGTGAVFKAFGSIW